MKIVLTIHVAALLANLARAEDVHPPFCEVDLGGPVGGGDGCSEEAAEEAAALQVSLLQGGLRLSREARAPTSASAPGGLAAASAAAAADGAAAPGATSASAQAAPPTDATGQPASALAATAPETAAAPGPSDVGLLAEAAAAAEMGGRVDDAVGPAQHASRLEGAQADTAHGDGPWIGTWVGQQVHGFGAAALTWLRSSSSSSSSAGEGASAGEEGAASGQQGGGGGRGSGKASVATSGATRMLSYLLDPSQGMVQGVPVLLIYMLGSMIFVVFFIQVASWSVDPGKDYAELPTPTRSVGRASSTSAVPYRHEQVWRPPFYPGAGTDKSGYTLRSATSPAAPNFPASQPSLPLRTSESVPLYSTSVSDAADSSDALCPALILPQGKAQFSIPAEAIQRLGLGQYPVEILGPTGRQLLHARLPAQPVGGALASLGSGRWLELTSTATSRHPHACLGPLPLAAPARAPLEIRGPRGDAFGTLEQRGGAWCAVRRGRVVLSIEASGDGQLIATLPDRGVVAVASPEDGEALKIQVSPGVDALLALLSMLAVVLMSPDLAGFRV
mmetsp:Transcript_134997/g.431264  ORF Transcript_134997/g.431264 Transcript_134997/m.431264 type:complete len:561 (-) Transcript_134997:22-1704(-)